MFPLLAVGRPLDPSFELVGTSDCWVLNGAIVLLAKPDRWAADLLPAIQDQPAGVGFRPGMAAVHLVWQHGQQLLGEAFLVPATVSADDLPDRDRGITAMFGLVDSRSDVLAGLRVVSLARPFSAALAAELHRCHAEQSDVLVQVLEIERMLTEHPLAESIRLAQLAGPDRFAEV